MDCVFLLSRLLRDVRADFFARPKAEPFDCAQGKLKRWRCEWVGALAALPLKLSPNFFVKSPLVPLVSHPTRGVPSKVFHFLHGEPGWVHLENLSPQKYNEPVLMSKSIKIILAIVILAIGGYFFYNRSSEPSKYDAFAQCLNEKGAVFYGAFWCSHCKNQKKMFGSSEKNLNYVECSTADGRGQLQVCNDKDIRSYPTWEFADGSRETGELSFQKLSEKTGCGLP